LLSCSLSGVSLPPPLLHLTHLHIPSRSNPPPSPILRPPATSLHNSTLLPSPSIPSPPSRTHTHQNSYYPIRNLLLHYPQHSIASPQPIPFIPYHTHPTPSSTYLLPPMPHSITCPPPSLHSSSPPTRPLLFPTHPPNTLPQPSTTLRFSFYSLHSISSTHSPRSPLLVFSLFSSSAPSCGRGSCRRDDRTDEACSDAFRKDPLRLCVEAATARRLSHFGAEQRGRFLRRFAEARTM